MLHINKIKKLRIPENFVAENLNFNNDQVSMPVQITTPEITTQTTTVPTSTVENNIQLNLTSEFIERNTYNNTGMTSDTSPSVYVQIIQENSIKVSNSLAENSGNFFNTAMHTNKPSKIGCLKLDQNVAQQIQEESRALELPASVTEMANNQESYNISNVSNVVDKSREGLEMFRRHTQQTAEAIANDPDFYVDINQFSTIDILERNILKFIIENLDVNVFYPLVSFLQNTHFASDSFLVVLNCLFPVLCSIGFFRFFLKSPDSLVGMVREIFGELGFKKNSNIIILEHEKNMPIKVSENSRIQENINNLENKKKMFDESLKYGRDLSVVLIGLSIFSAVIYFNLPSLSEYIQSEMSKIYININNSKNTFLSYLIHEMSNEVVKAEDIKEVLTKKK
jgi:hypothetical protein